MPPALEAMRAVAFIGAWLGVLAPVMASPLERGLAAKASGDFPRAERELATAVKEEPRNAEAWLHYGTVLGWQKRYDGAAAALDRGLAVAPKDFDLRLARIRVRAWQGEHDSAARDLDEMAREFPDNEEIQVMQGRVAGWREQGAVAANHYQQVLERNPRQIDALTGLGDLAREAGRKKEALDYYRRAAAEDPSPDVMGRITAIENERDWRGDAGVTASTLSGPGDDWWSVWGQVSRRVGPGALWGRIEQGERFGLQDTLLEAGWEGRVHERAALALLLGGSPDADWAAEWYGESRLRWQTAEGWPDALVELRHADYASGAVWTFRTGLEHELAEGWRGSLRWVHQEFEDADATEGWIATLERDLGSGWWFRIGNAGGAESLSSQTIGQPGGIRRSTTWFAGLRGPLGSEHRGWRLDLEFEDVRKGNDRRGIALGIFQEF